MQIDSSSFKLFKIKLVTLFLRKRTHCE